MVVNTGDIDKIKIIRKGKLGKNSQVGGAIGVGVGVGVTLGLLTSDNSGWVSGVGLFFGAN